jgi:hypothetical protein
LKPAWADSLQDTLSRKNPSQKWPVEWLEVEALSSSPNTTKKKKKKNKNLFIEIHGQSSMLLTPVIPATWKVEVGGP